VEEEEEEEEKEEEEEEEEAEAYLLCTNTFLYTLYMHFRLCSTNNNQLIFPHTFTPYPILFG